MKKTGCIFLLTLFYLSSWSQSSTEKYKFNTWITTQDSKELRGKLKTAEENQILLLQQNKLDQPLVIPAQNLKSLRLYHKEKNKKGMMIGMLAGTGVGAILGSFFSTGSSTSNSPYGNFTFSGSNQSDGAIVGGILGFIAGGIIGFNARASQSYQIKGDIEVYQTYLPDIQQFVVSYTPY